ncbi:MAG: CDP-alcohol phosphatidyltransferase family protein [Prevotellaceae bacterium]|nr:CDP-alcohol phosphatidyltransferase family protein [Prevotellaceae bacterium]
MSETSLEASLKSTDTEEWIDLVFYRPIGYRWALLFQKIGITPNAVTVASIFLGVTAGILFYPDDLLMNIGGICLLVWANMYDSADGQLARLTGQKSELGRILDGVAGDLWFISIYAAICLRLMPEWGIWVWVLAAVSGFSHTKQASMADYYRNIHLFFLKGKTGSELDTAEQQRCLFRSLTWKRSFVRKLFQWFYVNYTHSQEQLTPRFQAFFNRMKQDYPDQTPPQSLRQTFCRKSLPLMKYTNILSFNTRAIVLCLSLLVGLPWVYFVFELTVLNVLFIYMVRKHEHLSASLSAELP